MAVKVSDQRSLRRIWLSEGSSRRQSAKEPLLRQSAGASDPPEKDTPHTAANVVQFASAVTYAREDDIDGEQEIWAMRIGDLSSRCSVKVHTKDSPFAGSKFRPISGEEVAFQPGEMMRCFRLQLLPDDEYGNVTQVHIEMEKESCVNCTLGNFLYQTCVNIIDDDTFPTNKFKYFLEHEAFKPNGGVFSTEAFDKHSSWISMFLEFAKYIFARNPGGAARVLIADQINNLIFISRVLLQKAIINELSGDDAEYYRFLALASGLALPYAITHALSYRRQFWGVAGSARQSLLYPLLQRFMNFEEGSRAAVDCAQFQHTFVEESFHLVSSGYMQLFVLAASLGRIAMIFAFSAYQALNNAGHPLFFATVWIPLPMVTALVFIFLWCRFTKSEAALRQVKEARIDLVDHVSNCVNSYRLIAEYMGRHLVLNQCLDKIKNLNGTLVAQSVRSANDVAFLGWLDTLLEFGVMAVMGACVVYGGLPLGSFTAALFCTGAAMAQFQKAYDALQAMQSCNPALWHMVQYLNQPTDLWERKRIEDEKMGLCRDRLEKKKLLEGGGGVCCEDQLEITFEDVEFAYFKWLAGTAEAGDFFFKDLRLTIRQGEMLAVLLDSHGGAKTLARLLTGSLLPTRGRVFVPPHLRSLFVQLDDVIWHGHITYSVFFGLMTRRLVVNLEDIDPKELDRGLEICRRLNMPIDAMAEITRSVGLLTGSLTSQSSTLSRPDSTKMIGSLSRSTLCKIQLACALIADPEVLVLNKPIQKVSLDDAGLIMTALKEYVQSRGFKRDAASIEARRPRTCVIACSSFVMMSGVDRAVRVNKGGEITELNVDEALQEALTKGRHGMGRRASV